MKIVTPLFATLILLSLTSILQAQENRIPYLKCHYAEKYVRNLRKPNRIHQDEMVLEVSKECSVFYSLWYHKHKHVRDSVLAKGGGIAECLAAEDKLLYPSSTQREYIYKNLPETGRLTHTNVVFADDYIYEDSLSIPTWTIGTEQKTVAGYTCQKATTEFGGRTWTVWFAPELPISDGPWKLCGLPGLILEAQDAEKHYQFTCIEIERVSGGEPIAVPKKRYSRYSKKEFIEIPKCESNYAIIQFLAGKIRTGELLKRLGKIDVIQLETAIREQKSRGQQGENAKIAQIMIELGYITEKDVKIVLLFKEESKKRFIMGLGLASLKMDNQETVAQVYQNLQKELKRLEHENRILKARLRKLLNIQE